MTTPFSWNNPYAWPRKPLLAANAVSTSQPLAAQAGLQMLAAGGSAVDAILATAITLSLVEPVSNGIGSDAYAIVWDGRRLHGLNASGRSPAAWSSDFFAGLKSMPVRGWNSVSVPGCVSAWVELHTRFGKLPFEKLFERAIRYGREGFLVSPTIAGQWEKQVPELKNQPGFAEAFMPGGRAPRPGERFTWKGHADVLEQIAETRGEAFYRGAIAEKIEAHARKHDAAMRASDFAAHKSDWVAPLEMDYRGYTLHEIPPNGQGIVALIALGILEHFDLRSHPVDGADSIHLQIEAIKLAFADAWRYVADIDHMDVRPGALLDKEYLQARSRLIDPKRAQSFGIPIVEAMASGCPVITATTSACPEVAGDAAILVDPDDVEGLADAMYRVSLDDALAEDLRQRGLRRSAGFSWSASAKTLLAELEAAARRA